MKEKITSARGSAGSCIHHHFWQQVKCYPERIAIEYEQQHWSYTDVAKCVNFIAAQLQEQGVQPGDVVVINAGRCPLLVMLLLAVTQIRAVFHVIGENTPLSYCKRILEPVNHLHWISVKDSADDEANIRQLLSEKLAIFVVFSLSQMASLVEAIIDDKTPVTSSEQCYDVVYLSATSGSTGTPKLVVGSHLPISHFIDWYMRTFDLQSHDRFGLLSGLGYDPMLRDIFAPLSIGATLCIPGKLDLSSKNGIIKWLQAAAVSVFNITPALAKIIFHQNQEIKLPKLRVAALGGELLPKSLARTISQTAPACQLVNFYGTTETPQVTMYHLLGKQDLEDITVDKQTVALGRPIDDVEVLLLDEQGNPVAQGQNGEICIRSAYLYLGYLQPMRSREIIAIAEHDNIYHTGDIGCFDEASRLLFLGRRDRQVKYRGHRINLEVVESVISQFPHIQHCAVIFDEPSMEGVGLSCYYQVKPNGDKSQRHILKMVSKTLPSYMHPLSFICLEQMPLTSSGKVDRQKLNGVEKMLPGSASETTTVCRSSMKRVHQIWSHLLEVPTEKLAVTDNFFDLGGNSLLAYRLIEELNHEFGKKIEITDLFMYSNIKELSGFLSELNKPAQVLQIKQTEVERGQLRQKRISAMQNRRRCTVS